MSSNIDLPCLDDARWDLWVPCGEGFSLDLDVSGDNDLSLYEFAAVLYDVRVDTPHDLDVSVNGATITVDFPSAMTAALAPLGGGWRWRLVATLLAGGDPQTWQYGAVTLTHR